ncbi:ORF2 [Crustacea hepe-like virus 1]|nr:ORF2 [Crustacea hepe-like virus 1]
MSNLLKLKTAQVNTPTLGTITHKGETIEVNCETAAGRAWLAKYLHPPSDPMPGFCGYPDRNTLSTVQLHYRGEKEIALGCHKGDGATPLGPAAKYCHLFHWGARAPCVGVWYDATGGKPAFDPTETQWMINKQFDWKAWDRDIEKARRTYGSVSIYQDETAFSNRGVITVANFRPDWVDVELGPVFTVRDIANALKADHRTLKVPPSMLRSNTIDRDGYEVLEPKKTDVNLTPPYKWRIMMIHSWPRDESDLINLSRKAYSGMLREGAFITSRIAQDVNSFKQGDTFDAIALYVRDENTVHNFPLYTDINNFGEWMDCDFAFTWVMYSQMATSQDQSTQPFTANHILYKWYNGFEVSVGLSSSLSTFQAACAMEDETALRLANNVLHEANDADTVANNSWATLARTALSLAPQAFEWLSNVFGSKKNKQKRDDKKEIKKEVKKEVKQMVKPENKQLAKPAPQPRRRRSRSKSASRKGPVNTPRSKSMGPKVPLGEYLGNNK